MKPREIFYCNLTVIFEGKEYYLPKVVYKETDGFYHNQRIIKQYGIKGIPKVIKKEDIKSLGFENTNQGYSTGKVNDEQRNETTGAYE